MFEDFNIEKVKAKDKRGIVLSVRVTKNQLNWLKENRVSASKLFDYCLNKLIDKEVKKNG